MLDKAGKDAQITLKFNGAINAECNVKFAIPATLNQGFQKVTITNFLNKAFSNNEGKVISTESIKWSGQLRLTNSARVDQLMPIIPFDTGIKIDSKINAKVEGSIAHVRTYGFNTYKGPYYQDEIFFSGIKGTVSLEAEASNKDNDKFEIIKAKKYEFELFQNKHIIINQVNLY